MSIRSIATGARARTAASAVPGAPVVVTVPAAGPAGSAASVGAPAGSDTLSGWVPTEVVALYTTVLGVLIGVAVDRPVDTYLPLRWTLYLGCIGATCLAVLVAYYAQPAVVPVPQKPPGLEPVGSAADRRRRVPVAETVAAALGFGIWGLVIPGSPLYVTLDPPTLPVAVTTLSAVGVFLVTVVFGPWLGRPASARRGS